MIAHPCKNEGLIGCEVVHLRLLHQYVSDRQRMVNMLKHDGEMNGFAAEVCMKGS